MPEDLLTRIRREIDGRLGELRPVVEEVPRLEAALVAFKEERTTQRGASTNGGAAPHARRTARKRAPRGANRAAILQAIGERPDASAAELARVTGIKVTTVRTTLSALVKAGDVKKEDIGGVPGYHPTPQ